jgi:antitoxin MazE
MEISIIKIGNSKGIRISKELLKRYHITDRVELILEEQQMVIRPLVQPRKGWDEAFKAMHENQDDQLLIEDVFEDENFDEWE